ncbi:hypothetical protein SAMN06265827_11112 [Orenia metallireducens]|uniref:Prepilin-type N-terminal cleavage/methylation domain-containing protein n=1 Tax=Orenia metallireducens TaxID=1413210 RepID=A0A285GUP3_9FIRM|nr:type II secretion system protein [Orenia metallireducens]SNY27370.1 hypothetical protein SAMN06265827_11112 [Orenia metallireducens]
MQKNFEDSFALIELLIVIAIIGTIGSIVSRVYVTSYKASKYNSEAVNLQQEASLITTILAKDLRRTKELVSIDSNGKSIKVKIDSDGDGTADKQIEYTINQHALVRQAQDIDIDGKLIEETDKSKRITSQIVDNTDIFKYTVGEDLVNIKINLANNPNKSNQINYKIRDKIQLRSLN